jgi:hypothetical protein
MWGLANENILILRARSFCFGSTGKEYSYGSSGADIRLFAVAWGGSDTSTSVMVKEAKKIPTKEVQSAGSRKGCDKRCPKVRMSGTKLLFGRAQEYKCVSFAAFLTDSKRSEVSWTASCSNSIILIDPDSGLAPKSLFHIAVTDAIALFADV